MGFSTKAIHAGADPDPITGAVMPPIYMSSTFELDAPGISKGFEYTRSHNPNFNILENTLASLESAKFATVFSSGIGALTAMASTLKSGDKVLALNGVYGGTYRLFTQVFHRFGISFETFVPKNTEELEQKLSQKPAWILFETPTNPLLGIFDIQAVSSAAKRHQVKVIVDNTFASPYFQNPLEFGADVVWHSTTKYISGHSDIIGGAVICNDHSFKEQMDFLRKTLGVNPSPFDVWLATRGVKTLAVRMRQHQENAFGVAHFLQKHPLVKKVFYPGLTDHPNHGIAKKQMRGFGGVVSVEFNLPGERVKEIIQNFQYFILAESLGGVESLVNHPVTMTHASVPEQERQKLGITDSLIRLSIGIEDSEDLIHDLEKALNNF